MSTLRLLVIAADGSWSGIVPRDLAIQSIAALSADPSTLEELQAALGRFILLPCENLTPGNLPLADLLPGEWDTPHDAGIVILELVGRLVVARAKGVTLTHKGEVFWQTCEELPFLESTDVCLPYELSGDWLLCEHLEGWRNLAAERRELIAGKQLDFRAVLYGAPLFDYLATRVWDEAQEAYESGLLDRLWAARPEADKDMSRSAPEMTGYLPEADDPPLERFDFRGSNAEWEIIKRLHVDWLLTPRSDLRNASPRDVALCEHERIAADLDDQTQRWTLLEMEPPGVPLHSTAARFSCFGSHEWIQYYDFVRELLWDSWFRLTADCSESTRPGSLVRGGSGAGLGTPEERKAFRESESARLAARAEAWLDTPCFDFPKRTPRTIIERERTRLPEIEREHHATLEPGCPICEMLGSSSNPIFWRLDGSNMDDDFAFDLYCGTQEEWREKQVDWQRFMSEVIEKQLR